MNIQEFKKKLSDFTLFRNVYSILLSSKNSVKLKGKNNQVHRAEAILKSCSIQVEGENNIIDIDRGCYLKGVKIFMRGSNLVLKINKSVFVGEGSVLWMEDENGLLEIGSDSSLEKVGIAVAEGSKVSIGKDCMLSYEVDIRCSDSHGIFDRESQQRINSAAHISIGDRVWIGAKAMILKGVTISDGSVVGAGSIVTKSVGKNTIVAGNPAREVRSNIVWSRSTVHTFSDLE